MKKKDASKITTQKINTAEKLAAMGKTRSFIAKELSVTPSTIYNWEKRGRASENPEDPYRQFFDALWRGEAEAIQHKLDLVEKAGSTGIKSTKTKTIKDAAGCVIEVTQEDTTSVQLKAILWQLENRYGFNSMVIKEKERLLNALLMLAKNSLTNTAYNDFLNGIRNSQIGKELEIEDWLILNGETPKK